MFHREMNPFNAPASSRTVRVFLSSTFRDFAEERDLLVRKVFPELRRKCRERQVELVDVDLRWGITEKEAQQGKVLPICLAEIDRSRPYFIGFLGERYGWVPDRDQYDLSLLLEQPWLDEHRGGKSVTELEILHGVLNNPAMAGRALFYFRDPAYSRKKGGHYLGEGLEERARLDALKERVRRSGFPVVENYRNPQTLAERVKSDLWQLIDETYPEAAVPDELTLERQRHEAYGAPRQRLYLGGERYLKSLDEAMAAEAFHPVLVTGQSGGGKSALLANWAAARSRRHPESALVVHHLGCGADAADPVRLVTRLMQEIARITGEDFKPESDPDKQLEQLPHWLVRASVWGERTKRDLVLVLDGLDKLSDRKELGWFPSFLPTRVKLVASCLDGEILAAARGRLEWQELKVRPLTKSEQKRFVVDYLGRYRKALTAKQTKALQGHPLSGNPLFLLTVLEELRVFGVHEELDRRLDTLLSSPPGKSEEEAPTVDDVFEHVLSRIEQDLGPRLVRAAMEAIWASRAGLFREELLAVAGLVPAAWAALQNALDEAIYESIGRISFGHDYLRKAVEDRYELTGQRKKGLHRRLADYFASLPVDARAAEELPWQWEQAEQKKKLKECLTEQALFMALNERDEYELLGYWVRLGADINAAYEVAWKKWGLEGEALAEISGNLAAFLGTAGCRTSFALGLCEEVLRLSRAKLGAEHPDTLKAMRNLAASCSYAGRLEEALGLREKVLRLGREKLGPEHPDTLEAMQNLAFSYVDAGRPEEAWGLFEEALRLMREVLGAEHPDTLKAMQGVAYAYYNVGRLEEALGLFEKVLRLRREKLGAEHPDTLKAMVYLAVCYKPAGRLEEALALEEKVLRLMREKLGPEHPQTLKAMGNLAVSCKYACRSEEALELEEEVLRLRREKLGAGHPNTLVAMENLAISYKNAGRQEEALGLFEEALRLGREKLGPEHPDTLDAMQKLAVSYLDAGRPEEALGLFEELLRLRREALGAEHPDTLWLMDNLACSYGNAGRLEEALGLKIELLRLRHEALGAEHPDTLWSMDNLAGNYLQAGRPEEAARLCEEVLRVTHDTRGPEDPDTLDAMNNLAVSYKHASRLPDALSLLRKAAMESPVVHAAVRYNLACYECLDGNLDEARKLIAEEIAADPEKKETALEDPDLSSIREFIETL
jgi:tetratricopeptide (TPR) repeat protein